MNVTKKIMELLNLLKTNKAKVLFLAGLIGLASSCKMNENEPEFSGNFGKNIPDVTNGVFYQPTKDKEIFSFYSDNNKDITGVKWVRDAEDREDGIYNTMNLTRTNKWANTEGGAHFVSPWYWEYVVAPEYGSKWEIKGVMETEYNSKYKNMTNQEMANLAKERIKSKNPEDASYAEQVGNTISEGKGSWRQETPFFAEFNSNGQKLKLKYSDFGQIYFFNPNYGDPTYGSEKTRVYSGGVSSNKIDKSMVSSQTFKVTAVGFVNDGGQLFTGYDSATLTIDAQGETIVMPFKRRTIRQEIGEVVTGYYKMTIRITNNSVVSKFEDVTNGTISQNEQLLYPNVTETGFRRVVQDNGLPVKCGFYGEDKVVTGTSISYYTDEKYIEVSGQGYRIEKQDENKKLQIVFAFGGTNRQR